MITCDKGWFYEGFDENLKIVHRVRKKIFEGKSDFQEIKIYDTFQYGKALVIDGDLQLSEKDEMIYSRAISWPTMLNENNKRVLITGGGDGHILREVLRFPQVESAVLCDIDSLVTEATQKYWPSLWNNAYKDRRAKIIHEDAMGYLRNSQDMSFDAVISDITDAKATPSFHLYSRKYFQEIKRCLTENGVCVAQAHELSIRNYESHQELRKMIELEFNYVKSASIYIPSFLYPEGIIFASNNKSSVEFNPENIEKRLIKLGIDDEYFDKTEFEKMFSLGKFLKARLGVD